MLYLMPPRTTTLLASPASMKIRPYKAFVAKKNPKKIILYYIFVFYMHLFSYTRTKQSKKM